MGRIANLKAKYLLATAYGVASLFFSPAYTHAQAIYAATEEGHIQFGAGAIFLDSDYGATRNKGLALWADYDSHRFLGLEAAFRLGGLIAPGDIGENTCVAGPRFLFRRHRYTGYARAVAGRGTITNQFYGQSSTFNLYALGGGLEYKVSRRLNVRAVDFELQKWPDFKPHALSPTVITIGLSYVIR